MNKTFYLAGSYAERLKCNLFSGLIETMTGWKCNARWLEGEHEHAKAQQCAMDDIHDLSKADAFIMRHGKSTAGGMWVEFGMAIAMTKPVLLYMPDNEITTPLPVFAFLTNVQWVVTPEQIRGLLRQYEDVL